MQTQSKVVEGGSRLRWSAVQSGQIRLPRIRVEGVYESGCVRNTRNQGTKGRCEVQYPE